MERLNKRILIIDFNRMHCFQIKTVLKRSVFNLVSARNKYEILVNLSNLKDLEFVIIEPYFLDGLATSLIKSIKIFQVNCQ